MEVAVREAELLESEPVEKEDEKLKELPAQLIRSLRMRCVGGLKFLKMLASQHLWLMISASIMQCQ